MFKNNGSVTKLAYYLGRVNAKVSANSKEEATFMLLMSYEIFWNSLRYYKELQNCNYLKRFSKKLWRLWSLFRVCLLSSLETFVFNKILGEGLTAQYFSKQTFQCGSLLQRLSGMENYSQSKVNFKVQQRIYQCDYFLGNDSLLLNLHPAPWQLSGTWKFQWVCI